MAAERLPLLFGVNIDPAVGREEESFVRAQIADRHGIDMISVMDHPYLANLHETWTLIMSMP
jgi:alkanesulfonate monooxygenase SsuD/methylene tetrahydromethanopterin reductase-like flavin-dependent oxidoreductase (luciferase family)